MKMSPGNIPALIGAAVPKANGLQKVMSYLAVPVIGAQAQQMVTQYKPALSALGALTDGGMIDLDVLHPRLKDDAHKAGKVPNNPVVVHP